MADKMNVKLDDDLMAHAAGGAQVNDPFGYICEATVVSGPGSSEINGIQKTDYRVEADNGRLYQAYWDYRSKLDMGARVQLIHEQDGTYCLEPLML